MNVYCIGTPFQLISAIEARYQFGNGMNILIIRDTDEGRGIHRKQVSRLIDSLDWDEVIYWPKFNGPHIIRQLRNRAFLKKVLREVGAKTDVLLIGGFRQARNHLLRNALKPVRTIVLDDGIATYKHIEEYISNNIFCPEFIDGSLGGMSLRQWLDRILFAIEDQVLNKPVDVFTCFDIRQEPKMLGNIIRHDFPHLKRIEVYPAIDESRVDYLGSPLSERGLISLQDELELIDRIARHYLECGLSFHYLAHRDDSEGKLERIQQIATQVETPDVPAEIFFLLQPKSPGIVASAISTGLHNVFRIMPRIAGHLILIPPGLFIDGKRSSAESRQMYQRVREEYEAAGIQIKRFVSDEWN